MFNLFLMPNAVDAVYLELYSLDRDNFKLYGHKTTALD